MQVPPEQTRRCDAGRRLLPARLLFPLLPGLVHARAQAQNLPVIRYGGDAAFPPFESLDAQGVPAGFQIDLLRELGTVIGADIVVQLQPWSETETGFRQGRLDLVAMVDTAERRAWALFLRGHAAKALAIYRRSERAEPQGLQDIAGLRVAVLPSEAMRETLRTWLSNLHGTFLPFDDAAAALAAVRGGQADVALLPRAYADPVLSVAGSGEVVASRLNLQLQSYALAVAPGNEALRERLQQGLDVLENNGRLEALRVRWLNTHREVAEQQRLQGGWSRQRTWTWGVAAASTAALALLAAALWQRGRRVAAETQRRREAEQALARAEELLSRTFVHNPDPMLVVERQGGTVRDANEALLALLGVQADALIGQTLVTQDRHLDAGALAQLVDSLNSEGALDAVPLRLARADGQLRDCVVSADLLLIDQRTHVFCLVRDITEQLAVDAALRRSYDALAADLATARRELQQSRLAQSQAEGSLHEFTRTVSHDLKTPLNAVQGFVGLLRSRLLTGHLQEAMTYTEHIERAARRMNSMIDALSRLAQVTLQPLQRSTVHMHRLAAETWSMLAAAQPERQVACRIGELPDAEADVDLAAQVWQNLLGNAWKYTARAAAPRVAVDSFVNERGTWYRVTDNGAGFDMSRAQGLFQPFQRMHSAQEFEGTGVGLSVVRRIVEHHGGEVRLRSAPGAGTVAEFTLDPPPAPV